MCVVSNDEGWLCYGADGIVAKVPHKLGTPNMAGSPNTQWKQNLKILHNIQATYIFVSWFTLHREHRTNEPR